MTHGAFMQAPPSGSSRPPQGSIRPDSLSDPPSAPDRHILSVELPQAFREVQTIPHFPGHLLVIRPVLMY